MYGTSFLSFKHIQTIDLTGLGLSKKLKELKRFNPGDRIIAVAQGKDGAFQDVVGWPIVDAIKLIRGVKGSTVRLKIFPKGKNISDAPIVIDVVREKIILEEMSAKKEIKTYRSNG